MTIEEMLQTIDYKNVLKYFTELSKIPRGSGNNQGISDFIVAFAKEHELNYVQDEAFNVIIYKQASVGYEAHTAVILQGHMDMVCVKEPESKHDFKTQGLELLIEGNYLTANQTTLGADDGIAIAYALALLADSKLKHPALEVVITTDEETGMDGAIALDASLLKGRMMINIDSEDEDIVLVSCAGGLRTIGTLPVLRMSVEGTALKVIIHKLKGGHSGAEIHKSRVNATILMARLLMELKEENSFLLLSMEGGEKENAIPSYCEATIIVKEEEVDFLTAKIEKQYKIYQKEFLTAEPDMQITAKVLETSSYLAIHPISFEKILFALIQAPNGVLTMSADIDGLVETSLNLGVFKITEEEANFYYSVRSSVYSAKHFVSEKLQYLFEFLGGNCESMGEYPAWEYKRNSPLREKFTEVYEQMYQKKPVFTAIHAGLECGIICEKIPEMDIVSIGPKMYDIHSPKERLEISSTIRVYQFLEHLLEAMK